MKNLIITSLLALLMFNANNAQATLITAEHNQSTYQAGDNVSITVDISAIESEFGFQKLLSTFNFDVNFNANVLQFNSVTFGNKINVDPDPFFASIQYADVLTPEKLNIGEIGFALSNDLFFAQDGLANFTLATINFTALMSGMTDVVLSNVALADDLGQTFTQINVQNSNAAIGHVTSVPEPTTLSLFLLVLLAAIRFKPTTK